jgi:Holliday junction resolvasome RuvABC endonuclease subunit
MAAGLSRTYQLRIRTKKKIKMAITGNGNAVKSRLPNATATLGLKNYLKP